MVNSSATLTVDTTPRFTNNKRTAHTYRARFFAALRSPNTRREISLP
jgi:hypothetical protein